MKILITGVAGFIGSHLANTFLKSDVKVVGVDNMKNGQPSRIKYLQNKFKENFKYLYLDITDKKNLFKLLSKYEIDGVFHYAASIDAREKDVNIFNKNNIIGTTNILDLAVEKKPSVLVFASSAAIYGENENPNEYTYPNPTNPYGMSKLYGEYLCKYYKATYKLNTVILRLFNVYGMGQTGEAVIPKFFNLFENKKEIKINGDGNQTRDFINVQDICNVNKLIYMHNGYSFINNVINVGTGQGISVNDLYYKLKTLYNSEIKAIYENNTNNAKEIRHSIANIDRLKTLIGYEPKVDINTGLKQIYDYKT